MDSINKYNTGFGMARQAVENQQYQQALSMIVDSGWTLLRCNIQNFDDGEPPPGIAMLNTLRDIGTSVGKHFEMPLVQGESGTIKFFWAESTLDQHD